MEKVQLLIQSIPPYLWNTVEAVLRQDYVWLPIQQTHGFYWWWCDGCAERSYSMNSEVCRSIISAHFQPNSAKLLGVFVYSTDE